MGKEIMIAGLLVPFNSPNSYNETILPEAFDQQLQANLTIIPMLLQHKQNIGVWTRMWKTSDGIMGKGIMYEERLVPALHKICQIPNNAYGLSVTYAAFGSKPRQMRFKPRLGTRPSKEDSKQFFEPVIVRQSVIEECSLTAEPAFNGTYFKILETGTTAIFAEKILAVAKLSQMKGDEFQKLLRTIKEGALNAKVTDSA